MDKRIKAVIQGAVLLAVMLFFLFPANNPVLAVISGSLAFITLFTGLILPKAFGKIEAVQHILSKAVSALLTGILLIPFYYICFTIGRLIVLLSGKDPMERRFPENKQTYWQDYGPDGDPDRFTRPY